MEHLVNKIQSFTDLFVVDRLREKLFFMFLPFKNLYLVEMRFWFKEATVNLFMSRLIKAKARDHAMIKFLKGIFYVFFFS